MRALAWFWPAMVFGAALAPADEGRAGGGAAAAALFCPALEEPKAAAFMAALCDALEQEMSAAGALVTRAAGAPADHAGPGERLQPDLGRIGRVSVRARLLWGDAQDWAAQTPKATPEVSASISDTNDLTRAAGVMARTLLEQKAAAGR